MKVCLDSRLIKKGEYFVPIKGDKFDGHIFIPQVLQKGAAGIIEEVELYKLAKDKLHKINPVVIGVAGAVGKTTFRSFLVQVLSTKYKVLDGNLNTKLGLATNIVNDLTNQEIFVAELGIDRLGEMDETSKFINPNFCVITKFEKEHLEFLKDLDTEVSENLFCIINSKEHLGYVNDMDIRLLKGKTGNLTIRYFPIINSKLTDLLQQLDFSDHDTKYLNCIYSIVVDRFGFKFKDFVAALRLLKKPKGRLNLMNGLNNSLVLDDSYNAVCDTSIVEGLKFAQKLCIKYKKELNIVISPMRETGETNKTQHKNVADFLNSLKFKSLTIVGETGTFYTPYLKKEFLVISDFECFNVSVFENDLFYVKGSQFYRLEKVVEKLMQNPEKARDLLVRQDVRWS